MRFAPFAAGAAEISLRETGRNSMRKIMLEADLHTHTFFSDGKSSPEENVLAAIALGLKTIAITDHAPCHAYGVRGGRFLRLKDEVARLKEVYSDKIQILFGMEFNMTGFGKCELEKLDDIFDIRLFGVHRAVFGDSFAFGVSASGILKSRFDGKLLARATAKAFENYPIDVLVHPSLYVRTHVPTLMEEMTKNGSIKRVRLELNASHNMLTTDELIIMRDAGAIFSLGSDAHKKERVGDFKKALDAAANAGIEIE